MGVLLVTMYSNRVVAVATERSGKLLTLQKMMFLGKPLEDIDFQ